MPKQGRVTYISCEPSRNGIAHVPLWQLYSVCTLLKALKDGLTAEPSIARDVQV